MAVAPDIKHGKEFEKRVNDVFCNLYKSWNVRWERPVDTAAAGNIIGTADSDFRLIVQSDKAGAPFVFLIECKATVDPTRCRFRSNFRRFVKGTQNASMHAMRRAGGNGFVMFQNGPAKQIEIWSARGINEGYPNLRTDLPTEAVYIMPDTDYTLACFAIFVIKNAAIMQPLLDGVIYEPYGMNKHAEIRE